MNPLSYIQNMTSEDVQRYVRIVLQWAAAYLVTRGMIDPSASWVQPAIGFGVGTVTFLWTLYGNRIVAKINEIAKLDQVAKVIVSDPQLSAPAVTPSPKVDTK